MSKQRSINHNNVNTLKINTHYKVEVSKLNALRPQSKLTFTSIVESLTLTHVTAIVRFYNGNEIELRKDDPHALIINVQAVR